MLPGILGAGQAGSALARAAIAAGHGVVIANSRGPETLARLVDGLGPRARAADVGEAAAACDIAVLAFPYAPADRLPVDELAGKVVIDINNYMAWRDGDDPEIDLGRTTVHELRQEQLPTSKLVKAFTHIQFHERHPFRVPGDEEPAVVRLARPAGAADRKALVVSSDFPDAVEVVRRLYDDLGFDAVDDSPDGSPVATTGLRIHPCVLASRVDGERRGLARSAAQVHPYAATSVADRTPPSGNASVISQGPTAGAARRSA